jgi:hypothetical protein
VRSHEHEPHLEIRQHVVRKEPGGDADGGVPAEQVDEQWTRLRVTDGTRKVVPRGRRQIFAWTGALLGEEQPDADQARRARDRKQNAQRFTLEAPGTQRVQRQPGPE